jgi:hypothetical protein
MARRYTISTAAQWNREVRKDEAIQILSDVSRDRNIDVKSLKHDARFGHFIDARRDYAERCIKAGINAYIAGEVIGKDHTTIMNAGCSKMRGRKRAWREAKSTEEKA